MRTTIIKIAAAILVLLALIVYIKFLQNQNEKLAYQVSTLTAINAGNAVELGKLRFMVELNEQITEAWEADKLALNKLRSAQNTKIQKELQTNENFNTWAVQSVPVNVSGLLNLAPDNSD